MSMMGICALVLAVMSAQADPGPKANGCAVLGRKGVASSVMDATWASNITCVYACRLIPSNDDANRDDTYVGFFPSQVPKLDAPFYATVPVLGYRRLEEMEPVVHELFRVFTGRTEIHQLDLQRPKSD